MAQSKLRITHRPGKGNSHSVTVALFDSDGGSMEFSTTFDFSMTEDERDRILWYMETYLEYPQHPAPTLAEQVVRMMDDMGARLFEAVFRLDDRDVSNLWARLAGDLPDTRVEVASEVETGWPLPWELLRDGHTNDCLAVRAREFVRTHLGPVYQVKLPQNVEPPIRILLVICRPDRAKDVRFQPIARKLVAALGNRDNFQLDVLRPPTYEALAARLQAAKDAGEPYHILHFDGHGAFLDLQKLFKGWEEKNDAEKMELLASLLGFDPARFSPRAVYPGSPRVGGRGYLAFENDKSENNLRLVDGPELGALLSRTGVPVLVLNACRSGRAAEPSEEEEAKPTGKDSDRHDRVRAFGSFAQEVMDAGVGGVLAMRYNVYVVTAAEYVGKLYGALAGGETFGAAASLGRKALHADPYRAIAYDPVPFQDWSVPLVYESAPIRLFPRTKEGELQLTVTAADATPEGEGEVGLPKPPDLGFYGRDETLLALDRAFDTQSVVLLHAYAGSGKTTAAAEFARWYKLTGGVRYEGRDGVEDGPVLFTSFEQYKPLARVLDTLGRVFDPVLEQSGIHWLALNDAQRRELALQILKQIPVLWIWDNVEPVAGFPTGATSDWSAAEQKELTDFLRDARGTQAKFLLTSRRDEREWLGDHLPVRIAVPPMPREDSMNLARAMVEKQLQKFDPAVWRPLLRHTEGNPLTITVVVGQALRDGLGTREQVAAFVDKLRAGEAIIEDDESEGRTKSLGASLKFGFEHAFNEDERKQLALLHLFQGFVDADVLCTMGNAEADWCLPEVRGLTREAGIALLDRAAEVGLLTAYGGGYYAIHPALPWYFKSLFDQYYPAYTTPTEGEAPATKATRAFVEAVGYWGDFYHQQYNTGNPDVISVLGAEEDNLLHARQLARTYGWWHAVMKTMQGLRSLYGQTGRRAEWARLVDEIIPDFVDPATDGPLRGRENEWTIVIEYRVRLAIEARQWGNAERLQRARVEWDRKRAKPALAVSVEVLTDAQRNNIRSLAVSLHELGGIQRELGRAECIAAYEEASVLGERIADHTSAATCAFNLGRAYTDIPSIRDLDQAEVWYRRSLELFDPEDYLRRAKTSGQLGLVAYERFFEARAARQSGEVLLKHLNDALQFYHEMLRMLPENAVNDLAVVHNQLGNIYGDAGDLNRALFHYREAIRYYERQGNLYGAAQTRFNVAIALAKASRFADALLYAQAALGNYETYGDRAAAEIQETQELIAEIEQAQKGPS